MRAEPDIEIYSHQSPHDISPENLAQLKTTWKEVARLLSGIGVGEIAELEVLEITLLDDREMARVHGEFLSDATPTDVITFEHGELLIGVEVARRQAKEFQRSPLQEVALYGIHGMLHLAGFDDISARDSERMRERQEELLESYFKC